MKKSSINLFAFFRLKNSENFNYFTGHLNYEVFAGKFEILIKLCVANRII